MTITVTGSANEPPVTASSTLVTARDFQAVPRRTSEDALRLVPGVTLVQHGSEGKGYQFLVRGFDAAHGADFEVTVDGMPVNEWSNVHAQGYLDLGFVIPELVSSVRVTKGPFTLGQGAFALAGSADYHLGVAEQDRGLRASYTVGTSNRHRSLVTYTPREGDGHDFIASEAVHDEGFGERRGVSKGTLLARRELFGSERFGALRWWGGAYVARFELPGALRSDDLGSGRVGFRDSYADGLRGASLRAQSGLDYRLSRGATQLQALAHVGVRRLEVFENFTGYLYDPEYGDFRLQQQDAVSLGVALHLSTPLAAGLVAQLAAGTNADLLDQQQQHTDSAEQPLTEERALRATQALTHALAGLSATVGHDLHLDGGARFDLVQVAVAEGGGGALASVSPRAVAEWRALESTRFFAAYGRGFRPPEASAFQSGEPNLTLSDSFELGARWRPSPLFSGQLSGFVTLLARESVYDHVSGSSVDLNGTRRWGGELSLRVTPRRLVDLRADATWLDARFVASEAPVPFAPTLFGSLRAVLGETRGPQAGLRFAAVAPRPLLHGARSSTFTQLDASLGYVWPRWRIELDVENVLHQDVREGEYHYASDWLGVGPASELPALHYVAGPPFNARLTLTAQY